MVFALSGGGKPSGDGGKNLVPCGDCDRKRGTSEDPMDALTTAGWASGKLYPLIVGDGGRPDASIGVRDILPGSMRLELSMKTGGFPNDGVDRDVCGGGGRTIFTLIFVLMSVDIWP
jgi:hypothetical protein